MDHNWWSRDTDGWNWPGSPIFMSHSLGEFMVHGEKGTGHGSLPGPGRNDFRCISGASPATVHAPVCDESKDNAN